MNQLALGTILTTVLITFSITAQAATATDLKLSSPAIELTGTAPAHTAISALVVYTPEVSENPDMTQCKFAEDQYSPNGADVMKSIDAPQTTDGKYSIKAPLRGIRKNCKYVFSHIYMTYEKGAVYQPVTLKSDVQIALENSWGSDAGIDPIDYARFADQKTMSCDFVEYGLCHINGTLPDMYYSVSISEQHLTFDITEEPQAN